MKKLLTILLLTFSCLVYAQERSDTTVVIAHYFNGKGALIKWLPSSSKVFMHGLEHGYNLYRADVLKSNGGETLGEYSKLNTVPIKMWSETHLKGELEKDSALKAAIIFVAGSKELVERPVPKNGQEAIERADGDDFLHLVGVFSAVSNNKVSEAIGLSFWDKTAEKNKKYLYKLELNRKTDEVAYLLVNDFGRNFSEKVVGLNARILPDYVHLEWFNNGNRNFPYYNIYRSEKRDKGYERLNEVPFIGLTGDANKDKKTTTFNDSITEYGKKYFYKIVGVNAFEVEGEFSDPVEIVTRYKLKSGPVITKTTDDGQNITLNWAIDEVDKQFVNGYSVFRASNGAGPYLKVNDKMLSGNTFQFEDNTLKESSNYYVVSAYEESGDSVNSIMKAHLLLDSIPPTKPIIVKGVCDTNGIVTLSWKLNKEPDLVGYRVFMTYDLDREPVRVIPGHILDSVITDTLSLKRPYNKVYYRIAALDNHFNPSLPSDFMEVVLPDKNPPTNGSLTKYKVGMTGVEIEWQRSTAYDLKSMRLLRKSDEDFEFKVIAEFSGDSLDVLSFTDTTTKSFVTYQYTLESIDFAGLSSGYSDVFVIEQFDKRKIPSVKNLEALVNKENRMIKLNWDFAINATQFRVYRQSNDGDLRTYKYVDGRTREYYDKGLKPNTEYTYLIVAQLPGGYSSGYSNKVTVKY